MIKFRIHTFGCKANSYDSSLVDNILSSDHGFAPAGKGETPDVILVNTCTVTDSADSQARQYLRRLKRENPDSRLFAFGCYARVDPDGLLGTGILDGVIDLDPSKVGEELKRRIKGDAADDGGTSGKEIYLEDFSNRTRAFIKVQDGCDTFCSYCIVPFARGNPRSMPPDNVIKQLRVFHSNGYKEVVLTGIHLGIYGKDLADKTDLLALLRRIEKESPVQRIRLSSIEPDEVSDDLIAFVAAARSIVRHFHLPVQSGDESILKCMKRKYDREFVKGRFDSIKRLIPDCGIGMDIIVGFPGEKDDNFTNTFNLVNILPASYLHVFPFSPRKGTVAYGLKDRVDPKVVKARKKRLIDLGRAKRTGFRDSLKGSLQEVLVERKLDRETGFNRGFTGNYVPVILSGVAREDLFNSIVKVKMEGLKEDKVFASLL